MADNLIITIGGGSRGLGKSLLDIFNEKGFNCAAFHRSAEIEYIKNYFFDIEKEDSLPLIIDDLLTLIGNSEFKKYSIHFISGGGLGVNFLDNNYLSFQKVLNHNLVVPATITSTIFNYLNKNELKKIDLFYYSSAVVENFKASPYYVSAKTALENFFKSSFLLRPSNLRMFLIRLGFVDIEHKYFHQISKNNPDEFQRLVLDNLPSKHFSKPNEVANFAYQINKDGDLMNGMMCDLTGGHSWI